MISAARAKPVFVPSGQSIASPEPTKKWAVASARLKRDMARAGRSRPFPSGFKIDRYAQIWEDNPFTLMKPAAPNENNLHLVEMHPNPNPQLVEVVVSDGKEQGTVQFRFDAQPTTGQTPLAPAGQGSAQTDTGACPSASPAGLPSPGPTLPMNRLHPGVRKYHTEGQPGPNSARKGPPRKTVPSNPVRAQ
jgi:hypothetical protein